MTVGLGLLITKSARLDSNQRSRRSKRRGMANFPTHSRTSSVQRESNPHFRHGKAVGCRYIMDAFWLFNCQRAGRGRRPEVREKRGVPFCSDLRPLTSLLSPSGVGGSRTRIVPVKSRVLCLSASTPSCVRRRFLFSWRPGDRTQRVELIRPNRSTRPSPPSAYVI